MTIEQIPKHLILLPVLALGMVGCARPLGSFFQGDNNSSNNNHNGNLNDNQNYNSNQNNSSVNDPPAAFCPEQITTMPGRPVLLEGDGDDDHGIVGWIWQVVAAPPGSSAAPDPVNSQTTSFDPDMVGDFSLRLTVVDGGGLIDSCETTVLSRINPPLAICPDDMQVPTRTPVALVGAGEDDGTIVGWTWEVISHNTDTDPELAPTNTQSTTFEALRVGMYTIRLTVEDDMGLTNWCQFTITTTPTGPTAICPADMDTVPLVQIGWSGDGEDDGSIVSWHWQMLDQPDGSSAAAPAPASSQSVTFTPDLVGTYLMRLTVEDDDGMTDSCELTIFALGEGLRVEIFWNPPEDPMDITDVDLHLLHPSSPAWFDQQGDCYYSNCVASAGAALHWDVPGFPGDDPRLDIDDTNGFGPENINIDEPVIGHQYKVGVHYFSDAGQGPSDVYVKIYCGTISINPVFEAGPMTLNGNTANSWGNDFWKVATVTWNGATCSVLPINQVVTGLQASNAP